MRRVATSVVWTLELADRTDDLHVRDHERTHVIGTKDVSIHDIAAPTELHSA